MPQEPQRRRRRPQASQPAQEESEPKRIVIAGDGEQPEWLVSAGSVSGAASRRAKQYGPDKAEQERSRAARGEKPRAEAAAPSGEGRAQKN